MSYVPPPPPPDNRGRDAYRPPPIGEGAIARWRRLRLERRRAPTGSTGPR